MGVAREKAEVDTEIIDSTNFGRASWSESPAFVTGPRTSTPVLRGYRGREITKAIDPWPHSEAGRFHRGIAIVMVAVAALVIAAGAVLHHGGADLAVLGAAAVISGLAAVFLLADLRDARAGYPWAEEELGGAAGGPGSPRPRAFG